MKVPPLYSASSPARRATGKRADWDGYFINLDRSHERRLWIEQQLGALGLGERYHRYPAIDGRSLTTTSKCSPGEVGIFRSHLDIIEKAAKSGRPVHVMEDDIIICDLTAPAIAAAIRNKVLDHFDILFLETQFEPSQLRTFHLLFEDCKRRHWPISSAEQLQIVDLKQNYRYGTTSYLVGPRSIDRLVAIFRREWQRGPTVPIDKLIQQEVRAGRLRVGCIFPFVSAIDLELSQVSEAGRDEAADNALVQRLLRYSFYVRADIAGYAVPAMNAAFSRLPNPDPDDAARLRADILRYFLWQPERPAVEPKRP